VSSGSSLAARFAEILAKGSAAKQAKVAPPVINGVLREATEFNTAVQYQVGSSFF